MAKWERSGESYRKFAEAEGDSVHTLKYWVFKLREEAPQAERAEKPAFAEVHGAVSSRAEPGYRLRLGEGLVLELPEHEEGL